MAVPKRVAERVQSTLKQFVPVLNAQKARDVSEADTVTLVKDVLAAVFGYDKYAELTSEHSIRGTYCDLAVKLDGKVQLLIEVKAIGLDLKDNHVKQAVDYAANQGVEWVILTNGIYWVLYHVLFQKPIDKEEICRIDLLDVNPREDTDLERLYLLTKEGVIKNALGEYRDRKDATNRFMLAAILLNSDAVMSAIRREVRRVSELMVEVDVIQKALREQVIKREALEGDPADTAVRRFNRCSDKSIVKTTERTVNEAASVAVAAAPQNARS